MKKYIVVEGKFDKKVFEKLLPKKILKETNIIISEGYTSSISLAKSIYSNGNNKTIIVADSDSVDENEISEKYNFIKKSFEYIPSNSMYKIVLFTPEIEKLFFFDKSFVESFFKIKLSDYEIEAAKRDPRFFINRYSDNENNFRVERERLLKKLSKKNIEMIVEKNIEINNIILFLKD